MIHLRPYKKEDSERLVEIRATDEVQKFNPTAKTTAKEYNTNVIKQEANRKLNLNYSIYYTICITENRKEIIIGSLVFRVNIRNNEAEIGIVIDPSYHGKGYGTQAMISGISIAKKLKLKKLIAETYSNNEKSKRSLMKSGFKIVSVKKRGKLEICRLEYEL